MMKNIAIVGRSALEVKAIAMMRKKMICVVKVRLAPLHQP